MKMKKMAAIAVSAVCTLSLLTGCGASSGSSYAKSDYAPQAAYEEAYAEEAYGAAAYDDYEADNEYEMAESSSSGEAKTVDFEPDQEAAFTEDKLVYTAYMTIQTLSFQDSSSYVRGKISEFGGIVEEESTYDSNSRWYYYEEKSRGTLTSEITVRIPSANFKAFLASLEGAGGKIVNQSQSVQNITKRYNDQSILIESLKTQEERLLAMMDKAETVEDMIYIEERLSEVQTQLNQAKNVLSGMDTDVAYSTIHLTLQEVVRYESTRVETTFVDRLLNTIEDSWDSFLGFLEGFLFFLIYLFPMACLVLIILLVVFLIRKAYLKAHPEKAQAAAERKAAKKAAREAAKEARLMRKKGSPRNTGVYNDPGRNFTAENFGKDDKTGPEEENADK